MFRAVNSRVSFPDLEQSILDFWRKNDIFERSVESRKQGKRFVFYEGPPTANGSPGIHHILARVFKDVIPRYKTMKGYYAPRIAGWDTHGLPVELEVERKLGFSTKSQIEEFGIDRFNSLCRENVSKYLGEWRAMTERIGFWVDLDRAYITMDNSYIETVWWAIKQLWDRGLVYQGYRVTPHCPRCGTSLSSHEVALGYRENAKDPSVFIKFPVSKSLYKTQGFLENLQCLYGDRTANFIRWILDITGDSPVFLLAWTTTPWTLPGNTALAVAADAEYSIVKHENEYIILASSRLEHAGLTNATIIDRVSGADLVDLRYEPLYNPFYFGIPIETMSLPDQEGKPSPEIWREEGNISYPVIATDFVSMEEGTGIVHVAPAYGEVDYQAGRDNCLDFVHPVDIDGKISGCYPFSGRFVKDADPLILDELKSRGLLFRCETLYHTYPFCWRCESPLLYYAKQTWYIRTTAAKEALIRGNQQVNWYPEHIKYGRFGDWLENNIDWAFSRERYWGTPLPVWRCNSCSRYECIGSIDELMDKSRDRKIGESLDLHRPFVDNVTFSCDCGGTMKREPDVIDCWFDSGAMPIAQSHYPFENKSLLEDGRFPADYICEAVDQTRGWFYSLHAISVLLFGQPCFRNVICLGHILDDKGEKMSKARGNVVQPMSIINLYGVDSLRWYCLTASPPGNVRRFSAKLVSEINRRFLLTLWNVYSFFVTYANIDRFSPQTTTLPVTSVLDKWIISDLNQLITDVDSGLETYNPTDAGRKIEGFVDSLSNWYVRRSRRRFWKSENDADKLSAYQTLYNCLVTLSKLLAPFTPFLAEELYQNLVVNGQAVKYITSVHLTDFPAADATLIDRCLSEDIKLAMKLSSLGRAARSKAGIKVRQPLAANYVSLNSPSEKISLERIKADVMEELNIKDLKVMDDLSVLGDNYIIIEESGQSIAVPTEISPDLLAEGLAREIVHRLQNMRRSAGFDIANHIATYYQGDEYVRQVINDFADYIKQDTLSLELTDDIPCDGILNESYRLEGHDIKLGVKRLD